MGRAWLLFCLLTAGCTTARMHSAAELSALGRTCGVSEGELVQDEELPRVLVLMRPGATAGQRACVGRWAKRNNLHVAWVEGISRSQVE
jgi:hypothetical protein